MIDNKRVKSRGEIKLLGITKDVKLSFTTHNKNSAVQQVIVYEL